LTKFKIIGNTGQQPVETFKTWLKEYLQRFHLYPEEVYLVFIEKSSQLEWVIQEYMKSERLSSEERLLIAERKFETFAELAYLLEPTRKEGTPPIILIKKDSQISKHCFLHEVAHIAEDKKRWNEIKLKAFKLIDWDLSPPTGFLFWLTSELSDFFCSEMICHYGLINEAIQEKEGRLNFWLKKHFPLYKESKIIDFGISMTAAFLTTLPPSYPRKEDEEKLEKIVIDYIRQMSMEPLYRKIKSIVSKLESPPKVSNIYQCGAEIIELAQEFLSK
jgi:hypothetical protein